MSNYGTSLNIYFLDRDEEGSNDDITPISHEIVLAFSYFSSTASRLTCVLPRWLLFSSNQGHQHRYSQLQCSYQSTNQTNDCCDNVDHIVSSLDCIMTFWWLACFIVFLIVRCPSPLFYHQFFQYITNCASDWEVRRSGRIKSSCIQSFCAT